MSAENVTPIKVATDEHAQWRAVSDDKRQRALAACELALEQLKGAYSALEARFCDEELPEPPGWSPLEALYLLDQTIGMLQPLGDDEDED